MFVGEKIYCKPHRSGMINEHPRSVCVRVSIFAAPVFIDVTADNGPETGQT